MVSAAIFSLGVYGALSRRNAVGILMGVELVLNAVNINMVAFWRYIIPTDISGQVFAISIISVAAAEAAVGLAIIIAVYRQRHSAIVNDLDILKH
jgi:NADH-quinone oxidoreductase subunit K